MIFSVIFILFGTYKGIIDWKNSKHVIQKMLNEKFIIQNLDFSKPFHSPTISLALFLMISLVIYFLVYYIQIFDTYYKQNKQRINDFDIIYNFDDNYILKIPENIDFTKFNTMLMKFQREAIILGVNQVVLVLGLLVFKLFEVVYKTGDFMQYFPNLLIGTFLLILIVDWIERWFFSKNQLEGTKNYLINYFEQKIKVSEEKMVKDETIEKNLAYYSYYNTLLRNIQSFKLNTKIDKEKLIKLIQLTVPFLIIKAITLFY